MLSQKWSLLFLTALAPALWGTTYFTTTRFLLPDHPLLTATLRAVPAGLVLLSIARRLPRGHWWWKATVLGVLNITVFFVCLFVAAGRLPGGVAAVVGGVQPLLVAVLGSVVLAERVNAVVLAAGVGGAAGVGLVVLRADAGLDPVGVAAALAGAVSMATGTVLARRWGQAEPPLVTTSWQLLLGGLLLVPITLVLEPLPSTALTPADLIGYAYLTLVGTAGAYLLWFRGLTRLPARVPAFLGLLSPVVALTIGTTAAGETLTRVQAAGLVVILGSIAVVLLNAGRTRPGEALRRDESEALEAGADRGR